MAELYSQFTALIANFRTLASDIVRKKGGIVFEWPTNNKLWREAAVQDMMKELGLQKVNFNGCRFGLEARKGKAICKPWTFATNIQCVVEIFGTYRCERDHEHAVCTGEELKRTESYTPEMCDLLHLCIEHFVQNPEFVACPGESGPIARATPCIAPPLVSESGTIATIKPATKSKKKGVERPPPLIFRPMLIATAPSLAIRRLLLRRILSLLSLAPQLRSSIAFLESLSMESPNHLPVRRLLESTAFTLQNPSLWTLDVGKICLPSDTSLICRSMFIPRIHSNSIQPMGIHQRLIAFCSR